MMHCKMACYIFGMIVGLSLAAGAPSATTKPDTASSPGSAARDPGADNKPVKGSVAVVENRMRLLPASQLQPGKPPVTPASSR
jgi:hypothetical protein